MPSGPRQNLKLNKLCALSTADDWWSTKLYTWSARDIVTCSWSNKAQNASVLLTANGFLCYSLSIMTPPNLTYESIHAAMTTKKYESGQQPRYRVSGECIYAMNPNKTSVCLVSGKVYDRSISGWGVHIRGCWCISAQGFQGLQRTPWSYEKPLLLRHVFITCWNAF